MPDLDAIEKATLAYLRAGRSGSAWRQVEEDFHRLVGDPHTIFYLVKLAKLGNSDKVALRENTILANLVDDLVEYVKNSSMDAERDPVRDYLILQAQRVLITQR